MIYQFTPPFLVVVFFPQTGYFRSINSDVAGSLKNVDSNLPQILGKTPEWPFCAYLFEKCYFFIANGKS